MLPRLPSSMHAGATTPADAARCTCRFSSRATDGLPLIQGGSASALPVSRPAQRSLHVPACMVAELLNATLLSGVLQSMSLPPRTAPAATSRKRQLLGGIRTHQENAPFHGALEYLGYLSGDRLERSGTIRSVIAWRLTALAMMGRETPELSADTLFSDIEIMSLGDFASDRSLPAPVNSGWRCPPWPCSADISTARTIRGHDTRISRRNVRVSRPPRRPAKDSSGWTATPTSMRDCVLTGLVGKRQAAADAARHCAGQSRRRRTARGNAGVDPPSHAVLDPHARRRAARKDARAR